MLKRFLTTVLATILFAAIFSWVSYVPSSQRDPNVYYFGFFETAVFVVIYTGPAYLLAGLPVSILIDKLVGSFNRKSRWVRYFVGFGLYSLAGILVGLIYLILFFQSFYLSNVVTFSIYGFVASNLYYHLSLLVSMIKKK
ncbi:hypothetical protein [Oceanobacillus halotolerans]|uniref:hypothetical protein n=1 Tax=Oceanobacillus halotolerans TaxID=2663380 RepID=UPI0013D1367F|nr:hypothetical protein [Oceanobacillus halotolerans]